MNILMTNDDGVTSPGLLALARATHAVRHVCVLAPDRNWSATGHIKSLDKPLRIHQTKLEDDSLPPHAKRDGMGLVHEWTKTT